MPEPNGASSDRRIRLEAIPPDRIERLARENVERLGDPLALIGFLGTAAAAFGAELQDFLDALGQHEPVLEAALQALASLHPDFERHLPGPPPTVGVDLPAWLQRFDEARVTRTLRGWDDDERRSSTYLVEISFAELEPMTAVLHLRAGDHVLAIDEFATWFGSADEIGRLLKRAFGPGGSGRYRPVALLTAALVIGDAYIRAMEELVARPARAEIADWVARSPQVTWIVRLALDQAEREARSR